MSKKHCPKCGSVNVKKTVRGISNKDINVMAAATDL
jgi:hypothetical protein